MIESWKLINFALKLVFFMKSMVKAPPNEDEKLRIESLRSSLRLTIFTMVSRGLFESLFPEEVSAASHVQPLDRLTGSVCLGCTDLRS